MDRAFTAVALTATLLVACADDVRVSRYPDAATAREDGVFERGWIPDVLPDTAVQIVEVHDLDTNARCARATVPATSMQDLTSSLTAAGYVPVSGPLPGPALRACPFSTDEVARVVARFRRAGGGGGAGEFAAVQRTGAVFLWAGGE